jgi:hypothetical protein
VFRRIEPDEALPERPASIAGARENERVALPPLDGDAELGLLPRGHPQWVRDGISLSHRAREALVRLRPLAVRVLRFWDHRVRSIVVAGRRVAIDPSGSYRLE